MVFTSTAKQRLWLSCLGYNVPETADSEQVRSLFEDASANRRYQEPPNRVQLRLASEIGISIEDQKKCRDAAGKLYHILLLRAWVYSVWRSLSGSDAARYRDSGLPMATATEIARKMDSAGLFDEVNQFSTTDSRDGDVWYRMSKSAKASAAFQYAAEHLPELSRERRTSGSNPIPVPSRPASPTAGGVVCLVLVVVFGLTGFALVACLGLFVITQR